MKLNARELRDLPEDQKAPHINRRPIYFILDNVLDTYNIGGIFRLADALTVSKIYICGDSEVPPNAKIKKASIGTYKIVPWEYCKTATDAILNLSETGGTKERQAPSQSIQIISIEQSEKSVPYTECNYSLPLALVVGNETHGVSQEALSASDTIVEIPMFGINKSLNVIVSAAIVGYHISSLFNLS